VLPPTTSKVLAPPKKMGLYFYDAMACHYLHFFG
jgi:hypothetical protein